MGVGIRIDIARADIDGDAAVAAAGAFARGRGAGEEASREVSEALASMIEWVLSTAYDDRPGQVKATVRVEEDGVHLETRDVGRPLAGFGGPDDPPPHELTALNTRVRDLRLRNLGSGGKRLACWIPCPGLRVAEDVQAEEQVEFDPAALEFRVATADDAVEVGALMHANYGLDYVHEEFYDPERLVATWHAGRMHSVVGLDGDRVVVHAALLRDPHGECLEAGALLVDPAYRGQGVALHANLALFETFPNLDTPAILAMLTTQHTHSQSTALRSGFIPTGLLLGISPVGTDGREGQFAFLCAHLPLQRRDRPVSLPSRYEPVVRDIYRQLDQRLIEPDVERALGEIGSSPSIEFTIGSERSPGSIVVRRWSPELRGELLDAMRDVVRGPAPMNYTRLDLHTLTVEQLDEIVDMLRVYDHFACALVPFGEYGHDYLQLQAILSGDVDLDDMALATDEAMRLRHLIYADHDQLSRRVDLDA